MADGTWRRGGAGALANEVMGGLAWMRQEHLPSGTTETPNSYVEAPTPQPLRTSLCLERGPLKRWFR